MNYSSFCISPELPRPTKAEQKAARRRVHEAAALHAPATLLEREQLYNLPAMLRFLDWCDELMRTMRVTVLPWAVQASAYVERALSSNDRPVHATAGLRLYSAIITIIASDRLGRSTTAQEAIRIANTCVTEHRDAIHWRLRAYYFRTVALHAAVKRHDRSVAERALVMARDVIRPFDNDCEQGCCFYVEALIEMHCAKGSEKPRRTGLVIPEQLAGAALLFGKAVGLIDEGEKPELYDSAIANVSVCLAMDPSVDHLRAALRHLDKARKRIGKRQRPLSLATVKLDWLHGLILARLHCYGPSYRKLRGCCKRFLKLGAIGAYLGASLDLALLHQTHSEKAHLARLATEVEPIATRYALEGGLGGTEVLRWCKQQLADEQGNDAAALLEKAGRLVGSPLSLTRAGSAFA
ncbi:MAG: hypothetical protein AAF772_05630 [Acidobacteriota bacterium]